MWKCEVDLEITSFKGISVEYKLRIENEKRRNKTHHP